MVLVPAIHGDFGLKGFLWTQVILCGLGAVLSYGLLNPDDCEYGFGTSGGGTEERELASTALVRRRLSVLPQGTCDELDTQPMSPEDMALASMSSTKGVLEYLETGEGGTDHTPGGRPRLRTSLVESMLDGR